MSKEPRPVKSFSADGVRRRNYTLGAAESLASRKAVIAQRNRKGVIVSIHFYGESVQPLQPRFQPGTRYSFPEPVGDHHTWTHRSLPYREMDEASGRVEVPEVVEQQVRALFLAVAQSVCVEAPRSACPKKQTVVSLEAFRRPRAPRALPSIDTLAA
jgi:hypothetical protein